MNLYPYQEKIVSKAISGFETSNKQMIVVPTGGGKTVIFSFLIKRLNARTLVVAHTRELLAQSKKTIEQIGVNNVTVSSVQKAARWKPEKFSNFDLLIIDECHRSGAKSYLRLINAFENKKVLGVTATPFRHDGQKLKDILGPTISPLNLLEMIDLGLLSDFEGYRVSTNVSLKGAISVGGDFASKSLAPIVNVKNRNELIVKEYKKIAPQEKALCFAVNVAHAHSLATCFKESGIPTEFLSGTTPKRERAKIIEEFKNDKIKVLVNCQVLTEGFDEPSITCLLMARPTCSKILYTQMIGRGSRKFPGKDVCKVIEFTDNEYDVSSIEELISEKVKKFEIKNGERLSRYGKRAEKLLEECGETIVERMIVIPRSIYERAASGWQRKYLDSLNVLYPEPLTEFLANQLILQVSNGMDRHQTK
jgi:superfamily II DNA or RNA helicase